jgi:hypothetical protein
MSHYNPKDRSERAQQLQYIRETVHSGEGHLTATTRVTIDPYRMSVVQMSPRWACKLIPFSCTQILFSKTSTPATLPLLALANEQTEREQRKFLDTEFGATLKIMLCALLAGGPCRVHLLGKVHHEPCTKREPGWIILASKQRFSHGSIPYGPAAFTQVRAANRASTTCSRACPSADPACRSQRRTPATSASLTRFPARGSACPCPVPP